MPTRIKNCGLRTPESIDIALSTGASFVGFVHHAPSPRHVSLEHMRELVAHARGRAKTVAVLVDPENDLLAELMRDVRPDFIQLHQVEDSARAEAIHAIFNVPIITAISVHEPSDVSNVATFEEISTHLLFDAPQAGSGKRFDWQLIKNLPLKKKWFLAGGLTIDNVAEAIRHTGAPMVDVSSGIEDSPGHKSLEKIAAFNAAVLNAAHA